MKIPWEKEGGKTNIVCVYHMGEVAKERESFFYELPPSPSPPIYNDGLAFSL